MEGEFGILRVTNLNPLFLTGVMFPGLGFVPLTATYLYRRPPINRYHVVAKRLYYAGKWLRKHRIAWDPPPFF